MSNPNQIDVLLQPLMTTSKRFYIVVSVLIIIIGWGLYAYFIQLTTGLGVTGMRNVVSWAYYIVNFVFFIGISHVGALMSAILRLTNTEWRRPITRMAEVVTVCSLAIAALMPIIDLGRPDRILNIVLYGRLQSPLVWDFIAIATYFTASIIFLYVPLIPDIALCKDKLGISGFRGWIYKKLAVGWIWNKHQVMKLEKAISIMSIIIIPLAVTVHTVVSYDFAMNPRIPWNSTIFGPYFVGGALLSGVATVIMVMAVIRWTYKFDEFITYTHFRNLSKILLVLDLALIYLTINEFLVPGYKHFFQQTYEGAWMSALFWGQYAPYFWLQTVGGLIIPAILLALLISGYIHTHETLVYFITSLLINIGMWVERFNIIIPGLALPQLPYEWGVYYPTWVELSITAGAFAGFLLLYIIFIKIFPIIPIWENIEIPERILMEKISTAENTKINSYKRTFIKTAIFSSMGFLVGLIIREFINWNPLNPPKLPFVQFSSINESLINTQALIKAPLDEIIKIQPDIKIKTSFSDFLLASSYVSTDKSLIVFIYTNGLTEIALTVHKDPLFMAPPQLSLSNTSRVIINNIEVYCYDGSNVKPNKLDWWINGFRYTLTSYIPLENLIKIIKNEVINSA